MECLEAKLYRFRDRRRAYHLESCLQIVVTVRVIHIHNYIHTGCSRHTGAYYAQILLNLKLGKSPSV